jgi:hypothetical protein
MILENFKKNNHLFWSWYEGENLVTSYSQKLKKETALVHRNLSIAVR